MKRCSKCGETKALDAFHSQPSGKFGRFSYCKPCANAYAKATKKRNYSYEQTRRWQLMTRYRITPKEVEAMTQAQGGRCALCGVVPKRLIVDHDHITKRVRGLLCYRCNAVIGGLDDPDFRAQAVAYLTKGANALPVTV